MSWEEIGVTKIKCPCGQGIISQSHYGDDWNRYEDGPVVIECEHCKKIYKVESEYHQSYHPGHGGWTNYYLTPIDYPNYAGVSETDAFGNKHINVSEIPFSDYLIENYTISDLKEALTEYSEKKSSSKVSGVAMVICKEHKRRLNSVKASRIIYELEVAIEKYNSYKGSYEQRRPIREQEKEERRLYLEEKRKHQIKLDL